MPAAQIFRKDSRIMIAATTSRQIPFLESLVTEVTPWSAVEESEQFPDPCTFPANGGSGVIFYGLDASGFQGTNCNLSAKFLPRYGTTVDDLNVYHKRMHSTHMFYDDNMGPSNQMPLGYMTFDIAIDGFRFGAGELTINAGDWRRETEMRTGITRTSYLLKRGVRITVEHLLPMGSVNPRFRIHFSSADGKAHTIDWRFHVKPRTRQGLALWDDAPSYQAADAQGVIIAGAKTRQDGQFRAVDDYVLGWGLALPGGTHAVRNEWGRLTLTAARQVAVPAEGDAVLEMVLHFGANVSATADPRVIADTLQRECALSFDEAVCREQAYWTAFFARVATIETTDVVRDYLFHKTLWLFASSSALDSGVSPSYLFVSGCVNWRQSTCLDAMHISRGLLQTNALPESRRILEWMRDYAWQKEERPLYWFTRYDGLVPTRGEPDTAFFLMTNLAMIPIFYAESIAKTRLREDGIYGMLRHVAEYSVNRLVAKRDDGVYYLTQATVDDLTSEALERPAMQDGYVLLTLRPILRKAHEYATLLGVDEERRARWMDAAEHLHVPRDAEGYLLRADGSERTGWPFCWLPLHCLSPQDPAIPPQQLEFWHARMQTRVPGLPWSSIVASTFAPLFDDAAFGDAHLSFALSGGVYGLGYFSEFPLSGLYGPHARVLACIPPYATPHGSYLYAIAQTFVRGSIWEPLLEIGPLAASVIATSPWSFARLRALGGGLVSAGGDAHTLHGTVTAPPERELTVTLVCPPALADAPRALRVGDETRRLDPGEALTFVVAAGTTVEFAVE
jgi:hypothetical protein